MVCRPLSQHSGGISGTAAALVGAPFADASPGTLGTAWRAAGTAAWKGQEADTSALTIAPTTTT